MVSMDNLSNSLFSTTFSEFFISRKAICIFQNKKKCGVEGITMISEETEPQQEHVPMPNEF